MDDLDELLNTLENSSMLLDHLVHNMLDYAQLKAGKFRKRYDTFNIKDCVQMVMAIQKVQAQYKNIDLTAEYKGFEKQELIKTDQKRLA